MHTSGYGIRKTIAKHKGKAPEVRAASGGEVLTACKLSYMRGRMTASEVASMAHAADQPLQIKRGKKGPCSDAHTSRSVRRCFRSRFGTNLYPA